jgi:hypothetical protein
MGITTEDDAMLDAAQARFDRIWSGAECGACKLRGVCPKPLDTFGIAPRQGRGSKRAT